MSQIVLPTPLPEPPRRVIAKGRAARVLLRVISLFVALVALGCVGYFVLVAIWGVAAVEIKGEATGAHNERGSRTSTDYIDFVYKTPAGSFSDKQSVSHEIFEAMDKQTMTKHVPVTVRYYHLGPFHVASLPEYSATWWEVTKTGLFALLLVTIAVAVFWSAWMRATPEWKLLRDGKATVGAVTGKRQQLGRFVIFLVEYAYDAPSGVKYKTEMWTSAKLWEAAQVGDVVTVLVDPKNEKKSLVYEYSVMKVRV